MRYTKQEGQNTRHTAHTVPSSVAVWRLPMRVGKHNERAYLLSAPRSAYCKLRRALYALKALLTELTRPRRRLCAVGFSPCYRRSGRAGAASLPRLRLPRTPDVFVLLVNVTARILRHVEGRDKRDYCAHGNVPRNCHSSVEGCKQPGCDERCWAAGDNRSKLITDRSTTVPHAGRKLLSNQRCLRPVHQGMRNRPEYDT